MQIELAVRPDSEQRGMTASGMIVYKSALGIRKEISPFNFYLHRTLVLEAIEAGL